ncbi:MAG: LCP family protein [Lachnospiraceae bacterium]|nr:LCP family protein [Lachnospiraceae bacterium]
MDKRTGNTSQSRNGAPRRSSAPSRSSASSRNGAPSRNAAASRNGSAPRRSVGGQEYRETARRQSSRPSQYENQERMRAASGRGNGSSSGRRPQNGGKRPNSARARAQKKRKRTILFIVEIVVLVIMLMVLYFVMKGTQTTRFDIKEEDIVINDTVEQNEAMKGYRNIALFGVDSRDNSLGKGNRTDTIMIASINQDTGEVKVVSVFRDTYLNLGNDSYNKCNSAYAKGGPEQAMNMLNMNLDMDITNYVTVGFKGVTDTIDALGGVEIDVTEAEIEHLNSYQISMVGTSEDGINFTAKEGVDYTPVTHAGLQNLNGLQATAYCRIRYVGNDFARAERQRRVLMAMAEKAKKADPATLNKILDSVFPNVATNLTVTEIADVLKDIAKYNVTESEGFPFEESRATGNIGSKGSCVIPMSLEKNVVKLHKFLFDADYTTSSTVKECSAKVENDTKAYVGTAPNDDAPTGE